jgi:hypothetical protein
VGQEILGGCDNYSFEGCCEDNNTVRWCENNALCELQCDVTASQLPSNSCCEPSTTNSKGCCDLDVWQCVCAIDAYCCNFPWDQSCSNSVVTTGCGTCPAVCPNPPHYCGWDLEFSGFNCAATPGQVSPTGDYSCGDGGDCTPNCLNRQCGSDGCQSVCGTCPAGQVCSTQFQCVASDNNNGCVPTCEGKKCGDDGCGELSCGSCGVGKLCSPDFQCIECVPQCNGRLCGEDGCGGQCGFCGTGEDCSDLGFCIEAGCSPYCPGKQCGDDGCGGKCGVCTAGFSCNEEGNCLSGDGQAQPEPSPDAGGGTTPIEDRNFPGSGTWVNPCQPGQVLQYDLCVQPAHSPDSAEGRAGGAVTVSGCSSNPRMPDSPAPSFLLLGIMLASVARRRANLAGARA